MNLTLFGAMNSLVATLLVMFYAWYMLTKMPFSFKYAVVRFVFYKDKDPINWVADHIEFLGFLLIFVGHILSIIGQLQDVGSMRILTKPVTFFFSSPLNQYGLLFTLIGIGQHFGLQIRKNEKL